MSEDFDKSDFDKKGSLASRGRQMVDAENENEIKEFRSTKEQILKRFEEDMYQYLEENMIEAIKQKKSSFTFLLHCGMHLACDVKPNLNWVDEREWNTEGDRAIEIGSYEILQRVQTLIESEFPTSKFDRIGQYDLGGGEDAWATGITRTPIYSIGPIVRLEMYLRKEPRNPDEVQGEVTWAPWHISQKFGFQIKDERGRFGREWRRFDGVPHEGRPLNWIQDEGIVHAEFIDQPTAEWIARGKEGGMPEIQIENGWLDTTDVGYGAVIAGHPWRLASDAFTHDGMGIPKARSYSGIYVLDVRDSDGNLVETVPGEVSDGLQSVRISW